MASSRGVLLPVAAIVAVNFWIQRARPRIARRRVLWCYFLRDGLPFHRCFYAPRTGAVALKPPSPRYRLEGTAANGIFNLIFFGTPWLCLGEELRH